MSAARVKVEGFKELERALRELPRKFEISAARAGLRDTAAPLKAGMEQRAPRSPVAPHLAEGIVIRSLKEDRATVAVAIGPEREFFYGSFLEFGTSKMPARPWARPAWEEFRPYALDALGAALWKRIALAARRVARLKAKGKL